MIGRRKSTAAQEYVRGRPRQHRLVHCQNRHVSPINHFPTRPVQFANTVRPGVTWLHPTDTQGRAHPRPRGTGRRRTGSVPLTDTDLTNANLGGACLRNASAAHANLEGVDLRDADLTGTNLRGAHLGGAKLRDADRVIAELAGADFTERVAEEGPASDQ